MSGINFLSENLIDDATLSLTTGTANAQFPLDNIKNESTTQKFRSEVSLPYSAFSTSFDGSSEYIQFGSSLNSSMDYNTPFSISMWVKSNSLATQQTLLHNLDDTNGFQGIDYNIDTSGRLTFRMISTAGGTIVRTSSTAIVVGEWSHIVLTYDGGGLNAGIKHYLNGTLLGTFSNSGTITATAPAKPLRMGIRTYGGFYFNGNIDDTSIWDKELTQFDITEIYNSHEPKDLSTHTSTANLIANWLMGDGSTSPIMTDIVGSEDGTMVGMTQLNFESDVPENPAGSGAVVIVVDLLQTRDIDTIAVVGDTVEGMQLTSMFIKTSVTNDFSAATSIEVPLNAEYNMGYKFITEVSHRFVQITVAGVGSFAEVSNIFIGKRVNLPLNNFSISSFRYRHDDLSTSKFNDYGQQFTNILPFQKRLVGTIEYCTQSEMDELDTIYLRHGRHKPIWVILDPNSDAMIDGAYKLTQYSYLEKMPSWNAVGGQLYNTSLELNQVV